MAAIGAVFYPLWQFLGYAVPAKPRQIEVHKSLKAGGFLLTEDFILFEGAAGPWAVSRRCTHLGCRLNYQQQEDLLLCPCHQSRFTTTGRRISGPAQRDLANFQVERIGDGAQDGAAGQGYIVTI